MLSIHRSITALLVCAAATAAFAQDTRTNLGGGFPGVEDKMALVAGDPGIPFCFGDGTGAMCPGRDFGAIGHGCENSWGLGGALLEGFGVARVSEDSVVLRASFLPPATTVIVLQGSGARGSGLPFGDGLACVGGSVMRLGVCRVSDFTCVFPDLDKPCSASLSMLGQIPARGGVRYYQFLYRDPNKMKDGYNLTNGWVIDWAP